MKPPGKPADANRARLPEGGLIDRSRPINFTFDGKAMTGFAGDTLASALVANAVRLVGRSFKYHRPRGILTAGADEPNALVTLRTGARAEPNTPATTIPLFEGLAAQSQNRWPSLGCDIMAANQLFAPLFVAGFYYKTFMWPAKFWERLYEPAIRRAAGLGALSGLPDPDSYDRDHAFCDLLIIGGGASGIAAALAAARLGLRVIIATDDTMLGGALLSSTLDIADQPASDWAAAAQRELAAFHNVTMLLRTSIFGIYDGQTYGGVERVSDHLPVPDAGMPRQRLWKIVAKRAIMATGAIERPMMFGNNDRPGVMMASAVSTYLNRYAAKPGARAVITTACDSGWACAAELVNCGINVCAIVDTRPAAQNCAQQSPQFAPIRNSVRVFHHAAITKVRGRQVTGVTVRDESGQLHALDCDLVAMSGGWNPAIGLASHLGGKPVWSAAIESFVMGCAPPGLVAAGAADGEFTTRAALASGHSAALAVGADLGFDSALPDPPMASEELSGVGAAWSNPWSSGKTFVDFQHDVTADDIGLAVREGYRSIEHLKRYTTLGMATDQGRISQLHGHAMLADHTGRTIAEAGTIRARPPYHPVAIGVMAGHHRGEHFRPARLTPTHGWAQDRGAAFVDAGQWKRAQWFALPQDKGWQDTVIREVTATRTGVGICDISTLGKIDVQGPDAGQLLDRLYINTMSSLPINKARYGVMLREDGFVMDDGTVTRFADDHFFVTATTANAARVMQHIDFARQVLWPELDVQATSVTENWATFAVAGPHSRALLMLAFPHIDLSNVAMPYMAAGQYAWGTRPLRLYRLSFSGELAFEVSVPATHGLALWLHLMEAGKTYGVVPYGTEALGVMRIEKGHPAGNELNGQTTAADLGLGRMMSTRKDFIGRVMAGRPGLVDPARPALVGLIPCHAAETIRAGAHLLPLNAAPVAANDQGYVTSAAYSPTLGHSIALALLAHGPNRHGEVVVVHDPVRGRDITATVTSPVFLDPAGERLRG
ncbi:sarcosine oxidase subunit alpha family protein [Novosphingobium sp.]|uniref:sarcosine oxidase subunit alpha family protein n=1 Tax=Novosphingobium sp. TaxID=1874826 RepID=UPI002608232B|nr:sarcosine oxidase subunit alpha family protein [Novosphingobium sp.]